MTTFETPLPAAAVTPRTSPPTLAYAVLLAGLLLSVAGYAAAALLLLRLVLAAAS